jgi:hypothetical protein
MTARVKGKVNKDSNLVIPGGMTKLLHSYDDDLVEAMGLESMALKSPSVA